MTLSDISSNLYANFGTTSLGQADRTRAAAASSSGNQAFARADARLERQQESTQVRLSAYGQIRSALSQLQDSSRALGDSRNTDTAEKATQAAQDFVNAYNNARSVTDRTINGKPGKTNEADSTSGALSTDNRASVAASQLSRTLERGTSSALRDIGISTSRDGSLSLDQQRFAQALQNNPQTVSATLAAAGRQVEQTSSRQVERTLNRSIANLDTEARTQTAQREQLQAQAESIQQANQQTNSNRLSFSAANGIRSYERIFSL